MQEEIVFKAGEHVVMTHGHHDVGHIVTIDRITPSGLIVIGDSKFSPNGYRRGNHSYNRTQIEKLTPKLYAKIKRNDNLTTLRTFDWKTLSDDALTKMCETLSKFDQPKTP